ncbi:MAG TPA: glycosyltransferase family 4 protein [Anaerolineales bacterium]|nr:glycosyltransferase family 4 protein [Anaerolineales bacterium]
MNVTPSRIGFVSTRFSGTDGVSLETEKWAAIFQQMGHECFYFSGESDRPEESSVVVPEAHFKHPDIEAINRDLFDDLSRSSKTSGLVQAIRFHLKQHLYQFMKTFDINLLVIENAFALPMNIPLGLALSELIAETNIPTIAHHHDFTWERSRYAVNAAGDYLRSSFPPILPSIYHVVINSFAAQQLALRTGASSLIIPNVMDFDNPPSPPDEYAFDLRESFGIGPEQYFLLQPTRIVPRKRIELAIELTRRVDSDSVLVITHQSGDEGSAYEKRLREYADLLGVRVIFGSETVNHHRGETEDGRKIYSLADTYQQADLVTYPSTIEGFGNAFLETLYFSRPLVISTYAIFKTDIQPKGFRVIGFDDFIEDDTVKKAMAILEDPSIGEEMASYNYKIARRHYSFRILENNLATILNQSLGS